MHVKTSPFAKKLSESKIFAGINIIAPDDKITKINNNPIFVGNATQTMKGNYKITTGNWHEYKDGKDIQQYNSNTKPGEKSVIMSIIRFIKNLINS